jgi:hypothetical protein
MRRLINVLILVVVLVLAAGIVLAAIPRVRDAAARMSCQNNLRQIGLGLENSYDTYGTYPPAAIPNDALPCGKRLSWLVDLVPFANQMDLVIDRTKAWDSEENCVPTTRHYSGPDDEHGSLDPLGEVKFLRCPSDPALAAPGWPGLTDYVGITGVTPNAAELALGYPGVGFFGCDRRIKREDIKDGTGSTLAIVETSRSPGPWTAGGHATARGLDPTAGPYLGAGGQFGSDHRSCRGWFSPTTVVITNVVFADASVRGLTDTISPQVLEALATIAGGEEVGRVSEE